jgi:hypothetical protein
MMPTPMTNARWRYLSSAYRFLVMRRKIDLMMIRLLEIMPYPSIIVHPSTYDLDGTADA